MTERLEQAFQAVRSLGSVPFPWISKVRLVVGCSVSEEEHLEKWRQFAHACHRPMAVCIARDADRELTDRELVGVFAHELGHVVGDEASFPAHHRHRGGKSGKTPQSVQDEADWISEKFFGIRIRKNRRKIQEAAFTRRSASSRGRA